MNRTIGTEGVTMKRANPETRSGAAVPSWVSFVAAIIVLFAFSDCTGVSGSASVRESGITMKADAAASGGAGHAGIPENSTPTDRERPLLPADSVGEARRLLKIEAPAIRTGDGPLVFVHLMPWFEAPEISDNYGWHWHMGFYDPWEADAEGKAPIASHYYPLTGPYDSRDPAILAYQVMLMKLSGIDGIIFDWYGIEEALDYPLIHEATREMVRMLKYADMKFLICYEDQSAGKAVEAGVLKRDEAVASGRKAFLWMQDNWFRDDAYYRIDVRPVVLDFGPQYFIDSRQWPVIFEGIEPAPYFVSLDGHMENRVDSSYPWSPMWASGGGVLSFSRLVEYLNSFYAKHVKKPRLIATAFPGFHDIYRQAGVSAGYGFLDDADGETFRLTLEAAETAKPDVIQIQTWNDYGEGTMIEPTRERGYRDLLTLQDFRKKRDPSFPYTGADLKIPLALYDAYRERGVSQERKRLVENAFTSFISGDVSGFRNAVRGLGLKLE